MKKSKILKIDFPWFTTTETTFFTSNYSSTLTLNSGTFRHDGNSTGIFYYEAIELHVNTTGTYTFTSLSNIDTYGYIYQGNFYPSLNIREQDDDTGGNSQFRMTAFLRADLTYILVVTTFYASVTGPFSVVVSGSDNIYFIPINHTY
jgi:hypothetical protein